MFLLKSDGFPEVLQWILMKILVFLKFCN